MPDVQALVGDFVLKLRRRKVEGSHAVGSQQRVGGDNQAAALADAVRAVGKQLIDANPVEVLEETINSPGCWTIDYDQYIDALFVGPGCSDTSSAALRV